MSNKLSVSSSPHIHGEFSTQGIMLDVIISLIPVSVYGCVIFGLRAALILAVCVIGAVLSEFIWNKILKKENSVKDLSAVVTGLLLGLNLPSSLPVWQAALGSVVAIIVVKQMFGGIGNNFVNPAIAARIVLMVSFPAAMTKFYEPLSSAVSTATPLANPTAYTLNELLFGMHGGCIGETASLLLIIGGVYLVMRRVISPIIPLSFIGTAFLLSWALEIDPVTAVFGGGLLIGAIFMASDYTTSPTYPLGKLIFGCGCGILTVLIRRFGSLPEGVSYSILFMNLLVGYINRLTAPKPFGKEKKQNA